MIVTTGSRAGGQLVLPLRRLDPEPAPGPRSRVLSGARHLVRELEIDLDAAPPSALVHWAATVRGADEACLLLDATGRVVALSAATAALLAVERGAAVGWPLVELVTALDFTAAAAPQADLERTLPPLRALRGGHGRGLLRLRRADGGLSTYDVVSVPIHGAAGSLSFLLGV